jgi:hypothetical protein
MTETVKIYKLTCDDPELIYYGSTKQTLKQRFYRHNNNDFTCSSRILFDIGNVKIHLLEECNVAERYIRENYYITNFQCVNIRDALKGTTKDAERHRKWVIENREKVNQYSIEYKQNNMEKYKLNNPTITCDCGSIIKKYELPRHKKSKKHLHLCDTRSV